MVYQEKRFLMTKILNLPFLFTTSHLVIYNLKDDMKKKKDDMKRREWKVGGGRGGKRHQTSD